MRDDTRASTGKDSGVCSCCHGSKGTGGIFGCKCEDNSRLLATQKGKERGKREPRG